MEERELDITAELANLALSGEERAAFEGEVGRMLEYFTMMNAVDLDGIDATTHIGPEGNSVRPDKAREEDLSEKILENGPDRQERFLRIPKVL